jgi:hypothetical protein
LKLLFHAVVSCLALLWVLGGGVVSLVEEHAPTFIGQELDRLQYFLLLTLVGLLAWISLRRYLAVHRAKRGVEED